MPGIAYFDMMLARHDFYVRQGRRRTVTYTIDKDLAPWRNGKGERGLPRRSRRRQRGRNGFRWRAILYRACRLAAEHCYGASNDKKDEANGYWHDRAFLGLAGRDGRRCFKGG